MKILVTILFFISLQAGAQIPYIITRDVASAMPVSFTGGTGAFSFTLAGSATTSAGVYKKDSTLLRTLWSNRTFTAGSYTEYWDGRDDNGVLIANPDSQYVIKVLSNNVQYTWQGTIGNTSDSMTGDTKHQGYYNCMTGLAFASNGYGYYCNGFSEGKASYFKLNSTTPQQRVNFYANFSGRVITLNTEFVATDNVNVYWAGFDAYSPTYRAGQRNTMVHATRVSDDANVIFPVDTSYAVAIGAVVFPSVISFMSLTNNTPYITGLAVQKTGNYLFVSRAALNQLQVLNKTTGALVQTLTYTTPKGMCVDANDNLWMITGTNTVTKYTVNVGGTLTATLTLSGLLDPLAVQVSPDGTTVSVADGSTSQQVKEFNNSTGASTFTLGSAGGYTTEALVSDSKFYFKDAWHNSNATYRPFIAYQPDGSFWVNDPGNFRVQHYNSSQVFIDRIMSLGSTYSVYVDPNDATKLFADFLEFEIDYDSTLSGHSGWILKKNWGANITSIYTGSPAFPTTLSNGKTYALVRRTGGTGNWREVLEFPSTGQLRFTGVIRYDSQIMAPDGAIQTYTKAALGGRSKINRYALTGFNGSANPIWSTTAEVLATTPPLTINDPNDILTGNVITSTDKVVFWNPDMNLGNAPIYTAYGGYHLGSIQRSGGSWLWKTEQATHKNYAGPYPEVGYFDIGNTVNNYAGGTLSILNRNLVTSYHGEFWKASQTNKYNHYLDNGLAIGQFGVVRNDAPGNAPAMYGGNALTPMVVADPGSANSFYLYHGDEAAHSGVHRWKITGLNTIAQQNITIAFPSSYVAPALDHDNLMTGLPFNDSVTNNVAGWTKSPTYNYQVSSSNMFTVNTSRQSYKRLEENDVTVIFQSPTARTNTVSMDLGTNSVSGAWKITGEVIYPSQNNINSTYAQQFLEVLDATGKVLTSFYVKSTGTPGIYGNTSLISANTGSLDELKSFEVSIVAGVVTFTFGDFTPVTTTISDGTGNWQTPKTLRLRFERIGTGTPARKQTIGIKNFKFYKDYL